MRKNVKKLQLNRETLHTLDQTTLAGAFAGLASNGTQCAATGCDTSCVTSCNSHTTCTSKNC